MGLFVAAAVIAGVFLGHTEAIPPSLVRLIDPLTTYFLGILLFCIGIQIGGNRQAWQVLQKYRFRVLLLPVAIAAGSLAGALLAGVLLQMPLMQAGAVGAGFGWYSFSAVLLSKLHSPQLGALAFLANVLRELLAMVFTPYVARYVGKIAAVAPGGATTMDVTLPIVARSAGEDAAVLAFLSGAVLSLLVPLLVPLFVL